MPSNITTFYHIVTHTKKEGGFELLSGSSLQTISVQQTSSQRKNSENPKGYSEEVVELGLIHYDKKK